jgi:signal transduction histidine kinase
VNERSVWMRMRDAVTPTVLDWFIALGLMAFCLAVFLTVEPNQAEAPRDADALGVLFIVIATGALVYRRRWPLPVLALVAVATLTHHLVGYSDSGLPFTVIIALYTVASRCGRRVTVASTAALLVITPIAFALDNAPAQDNGSVAGTLAVFVLAAVWGDRKKVRDAYVEQLQLREEAKERERLEAAERAVTEERLRIARELHDIVAHAMSVVAVQSGVGAHVIDTRPDEAKRLLQTISETSRSSLEEMRRLLAVLRSDAELDDEDLAPAPGLDALTSLAARVRDAGLPVDLVVRGARPAVPAGVDLAAYRIAQEALTNVLKHAGRAQASVVVEYHDDSVHLEVLDDGRGAAGGRLRHGGTTGSGQGLAGMRERAALYDGEVDAGPRPGGGFRVAATLRFAPAPAG